MTDRAWSTYPNEPVQEAMALANQRVGEQAGVSIIGAATVFMAEGGQAIVVSCVPDKLDIKTNRFRLVRSLEDWAQEGDEE